MTSSFKGHHSKTQFIKQFCEEPHCCRAGPQISAALAPPMDGVLRPWQRKGAVCTKSKESEVFLPFAEPVQMQGGGRVGIVLQAGAWEGHLSSPWELGGGLVVP